ncbi:hypothetical protein FXO37_07944 [Capsicum annuum]|nr:hypothetical protein FXO37_07944 [Capsicum annuum]
MVSTHFGPSKIRLHGPVVPSLSMSDVGREGDQVAWHKKVEFEQSGGLGVGFSFKGSESEFKDAEGSKKENSSDSVPMKIPSSTHVQPTLYFKPALTTGDNVISPNKAALVIGIMKGYEIDIAKILKRETYDRAVQRSSQTSTLMDLKLSTSCPPPDGYGLVLRKFLTSVLKRLGTLKKKVTKLRRGAVVGKEGHMKLDAGIPVITFRTYNATCTWVYFLLEKLIEQREIPVLEGDDMDRLVTCITELEKVLKRRDLPSICKYEVDHPILKFFMEQTSKMRKASGLILNTFEDLEAPIIRQLHSIYSKVYTISPLQSLWKFGMAESPIVVSATDSSLK